MLSIDIGIRYLAYCLMGPETKRVEAFGILDIGEEGVTHNRIDSGTVVRLKRAFDDLMRNIEGASTVVVENQPPVAKLMRVIQGMTEMYFNCREGVDEVVVYDGRKKIVGARTKGLSGRANYAQRKKAAVAECAAFLESTAQSEETRLIFGGSRKKDDLADALIQALRYIKEAQKKNISRPVYTTGTHAENQGSRCQEREQEQVFQAQVEERDQAEVDDLGKEEG